MTEFRLESLGRDIGCVIHGPDLRHPTDNEVSGIRTALRQHLVVFFRDQQLSPDSLYGLAKKLGTPTPYPFVDGIDGMPEVVEIIKRPEDTVNFGGVWHSDTAYLETPPMASLLYAVEVPEHGGDTLFANQALAYESLSETMKDLLCGLTAINIAGKPAVMNTRSERIEESGSGLRAEQFSANHPAVRTHPETGTKAIYVNLAHTQGFLELSEKEGKALLDFIFEHQVRAEFCCRFKWTPGTLAFWDNRWMQHYPVNDYYRQRRIM